MKHKQSLMYPIIGLLAIVNWLTFHDLLEPHTMRDWLILATTILICLYFYKGRRK